MASISTFARNFAKGKNGQHSNFRKEFRERWAYPNLATVRDAMEATDEALARKEQEAAYMVDGEM